MLGIQSEEDEWRIKTRSRHGHASDTTEGQIGLNVPRLKKHETMNAFKETSMEELRYAQQTSRVVNNIISVEFYVAKTCPVYK